MRVSGKKETKSRLEKGQPLMLLSPVAFSHTPHPPGNQGEGMQAR